MEIKKVKKKQTWGRLIRFETKVGGTKIRVTIDIPYDWFATHTNEHVHKYWQRHRRRHGK
jgi:hypothetical protein